MMKEYDEKTIWTSDQVPVMASYNKGFFHWSSCNQFLVAFQIACCLGNFCDSVTLNSGKMQHSLWVAEIVNSNIDEDLATSLLHIDPMSVLPKHLSFCKIWQGKGAQTAACKVWYRLLGFFTIIWLLFVCAFN